MRFEWDTEKEKLNIQKHGISFEQASYVFADPFALSQYDDEHSQIEDRWILLGRSLNDTILTIIHTFKEESGTESVRIISARKATNSEKQVYQQRCLK